MTTTGKNRICRSCGYFLATSSSRNEATLPPTAVKAELLSRHDRQAAAFLAGGDGGRRSREQFARAYRLGWIVLNLELSDY